jgi:hypothetical protein
VTERVNQRMNGWENEWISGKVGGRIRQKKSYSTRPFTANPTGPSAPLSSAQAIRYVWKCIRYVWIDRWFVCVWLADCVFIYVYVFCFSFFFPGYMICVICVWFVCDFCEFFLIFMICVWLFF